MPIWTNVTSPVTGTVISSSGFGQLVVGDLNYLFTRPMASVSYTPGAQYSFGAIYQPTYVDRTNLFMSSVSVNSGRVLVLWTFWGYHDNSVHTAVGTWGTSVDGAAVFSGGGVQVGQTPIQLTGDTFVCVATPITGLTVATHSFGLAFDNDCTTGVHTFVEAATVNGFVIEI